MGYFGSKATSGLCQPLIAMIPPHDTYIETHLGGGAIMKRKPAALRNIGIDRDARALDAFECDYPVELVHGCAHRYLCQGRRETRPKGGAKHCHRGRRGEMVRGGRDEAGGGVSRKRREGVARAQFPAGGDAQIRSSSPCFARGCG